MPPLIAGAVVRDYPGCVKVISGAIPSVGPALPASAKALAQEIARRAEIFSHSPTAALDGIPVLADQVLEGKTAAALAKSITDGKRDGDLYGLALLGRLCRSDEICLAVLARHKTLTG
jgi:hypothetical protein